MRLTKTTYLHTFTFITFVLALVRCATDISHPSDTPPTDADSTAIAQADTATTEQKDTLQSAEPAVLNPSAIHRMGQSASVPHRIWSVPSFKEAFPDSNSVQLAAAQRFGVRPVRNSKDAEARKAELVYVGCNPYFHVRPLTESIPYLVPRASILLQDIGRAFYDSLYIKGVPLHQLMVTSVLRSEEDIEKLRRHNLNASENSCHRFGTTFDLAYNKYVTVQTDASPRRQVTDDTLKWVLSEVLRDKRQEGRCYVKYERKQGCFHITVR